jgi:tRNA uridine 5-carbamoylmethylation protein Kti12
MEQIQTYLKSSKPIYLTGVSGSGKTTLLKNLPNTLFVSMQDIDEYDDILKRMKPSILDMLHTIDHKCICVIDNIDIIHTHEKKFLTLLLKEFKQEDKKKKTRHFSIILCGSNVHEKKIKEIMKLSNVVTLKPPKELLLNRHEMNVQGCIQKIMRKEMGEDTVMETEKATQSLLFHENIIDVLKTDKDFEFYESFLKNICMGDYYDRISFQKQLWIYNEMTYYMKILHNYHLYVNLPTSMKRIQEYRFTKILTKYSNEYNNQTFIRMLCARLNSTKRELYQRRRDKDGLSDTEFARLDAYFQ